MLEKRSFKFGFSTSTSKYLLIAVLLVITCIILYFALMNKPAVSYPATFKASKTDPYFNWLRNNLASWTDGDRNTAIYNLAKWSPGSVNNGMTNQLILAFLNLPIF